MVKVVVDPEYDAFKRFLSWACDNDDFLGKGAPESHPMYILTEAEGKFPHSMLKRGLRETIDDIIKRFSHWTTERVIAADNELKQTGSPTLSEMRMLFANDLLRIEKRGKLQSEEECFLVRNALEMPMIQTNHRRAKKLMNMLAEYEVSE